ncbi:MAG: hypothetical protein ACR2Q3_12175 [Woeseiaceae bacterium]
MDKLLARKIIERHEAENGLVQLCHSVNGLKNAGYRHRLVDAGVQFNDWPTKLVSSMNNFYARPLALYMASRTNQCQHVD